MGPKFDDFLKHVYGMHMDSGISKFLVLCSPEFLKAVDEEMSAKYENIRSVRKIADVRSEDGMGDRRHILFGALDFSFRIDSSVKEGFVIITDGSK